MNVKVLNICVEIPCSVSVIQYLRFKMNIRARYACMNDREVVLHPLFPVLFPFIILLNRILDPLAFLKVVRSTEPGLKLLFVLPPALAHRLQEPRAVSGLYFEVQRPPLSFKPP